MSNLINNYKKVIAKGDIPLVIGYPDLQKVPLADLLPGDRIIKLGAMGRNGKETSANKEAEFSPAITYSGIMKLDGSDYACFEVPKEGYSHKGSEISEPVYMIYVIDYESEYLYMQKFHLNGIFSYKMKFVKAPKVEEKLLNNYPGAKGNSGILQWLANNTPFHKVYMELCAGSAKYYEFKKPAQTNILNDINLLVADALRMKFKDRRPLEINDGDLIKFLAQRHLTREMFIYLDPPYPFPSRRSSRQLYLHEMFQEHHIELLNFIRGVDANVMISTRQNDLYDQMLHDWRKLEFNTVDRGGAAVEIIYMNYPEPAILHQYDYVGQDFTDRQRVKRKVSRFHNKIIELPVYEKHKLIQEMISNDPNAVKHFLTMAAANK